MRVLLIGDAYSIHVCNFIQYTLSEMDTDEIVVFHIWGIKESDKEYIIEYYASHNVKVIPQEGFSNSFENILYHFIELKKMGKFDVCHLFSLNYSITAMGILMRPYCDILIANYWGSDWLRLGSAIRKHQEKVLKLADYIVTDSRQIYEELDELYKEYTYKLRYIRYKLPVVEELKHYDGLESEKQDMAEKFGIAGNQLVVTCGYSGLRSHKQLMVINTIKKIPLEIRKKIFILIPAGYGRDEQNIVDIKKALSDVETDYCVIEDFMDFRSIAALRLLTDIFINMQPTDAYSSTMVEYCYCKKAIFCNSSIDYSGLEQQGAYYEKISDFDKLEELLVEYVENYNEHIGKYDNNRLAVEKFQGDDANNESWNELYSLKDANRKVYDVDTDDMLQMLAIHYSKDEQKKWRMALLMERIAMIERIDHNIESWLKTNHYQRIGIYGIGHLGRVVYCKLKNQHIEMLSVYDMNVHAVGRFENPVLGPDVMGSQSEDIIIITPAYDMDKIKQEYQNKVSVKLLTIEEWLNEIEQI